MKIINVDSQKVYIYLILPLKWPNVATLVLMRDDLVHPLEFVPNVLFYKMELYPKTVSIRYSGMYFCQ